MIVRNLVALVVFTAAAAGAQENHATSKGSKLVGGSASLSRTTREGTDGGVTSVQVSPNILFLVADKVALGGLLAFGSSSSGGSSLTTVGIGPAARVFFAEPGQKGQPYVEARVLYNSASNSGGGSASGTTLGASVGLLQMITKQVGISGEVFWDRSTGDFTGNRANNTIGLRFGFSAFLIKGQ